MAANGPHGDRNTYVSGCRCDECREANAEYMRLRRGSSPRGPWRHNRNGYQRHGCRCDLCVEANRDYAREWARVMRGSA